jgi:hypothetical protein
MPQHFPKFGCWRQLFEYLPLWIGVIAVGLMLSMNLMRASSEFIVSIW